MKICFLCCTLFVSVALQAQNVGIGTTTPFAKLHVKNGDVLFSAPGVYAEPTTSSLPLSGSGTRLMWLPGKSAFRVGTVNNINTWNSNNIGTWSFASGFNVMAAGQNSVGFGYNTTASGWNSTALGYYTTARAFASIALGIHNDSVATSNPYVPVATNPILYIGNGTSSSPSNAMVVYQNGNTDINGYTQLGETSPAIKMKKLTGTSAATQNAWVNIPHGLNSSKILGVSIIMKVPGYVDLPPSYTFTAGYEYHYQVSSTNIVVINSNGNSDFILDKNFTIVITYEQ